MQLRVGLGNLAAPGAFSEPEQLLAAYFHASHVGMAIINTELRFEAINPTLAAINGVAAENHIGKGIGEILGPAANELEPILRHIVATGHPVPAFEVTSVLPTRTESGHWIVNYFPIRDPNGRVKQIGALVVEITEQKRLEEKLRSMSGALQREMDRLQMLLAVNASLVSYRHLQKVFPAIAGFIRKVVNNDFTSLAIYDEATKSLCQQAVAPARAGEFFPAGDTYPVKGTASGQVFLQREAQIFNATQLEEFASPSTRRLLEHGVRTFCCVPLIAASGPLGVLNFMSREENAFPPQDLGLLRQVAVQIAIALDNDRSYRENVELKDKLAAEKLYLQGEIHSELHFEEIIGESSALRHTLEQVKTVAPSDSTVLVLGETGTGKELIARAIHRMSSRQDFPFIKVNCAAIPTGLLESELFGHEKGAFTGAISQKIGRLELADKGTCLLDEIGDIPLELQPKLLRVLQDQEFERLGATRTIRVNIRLIAATNRDLERSVADKEFRSDLFYRLNVFPIRVPPLRERTRDIPLLVRYFVQRYARKMNKRIETVPAESMQALEQWDWPGNVRELQNFIERSVILSQGTVLNVPLAELRNLVAPPGHDATMQNVQREHILNILRETGGVVAGMHGAAARLGLKRTTLQSLMLRMGISRKDYER